MHATTSGDRLNVLNLTDDVEVHPTGILSRLFYAPTSLRPNRKCQEAHFGNTLVIGRGNLT
jgi:hypothetical protein